ncbi:hypothetical protein [Labrys monachus]|uniref:DUF4864 domain-containing protein n=1 Tax=Labrys monachus TaxID=217067 RepID=A0ABU0FP38_9HYPH|nr:hypothetical protein [Labrys monachus]MDQ0395838.1 hypothetical protein [Labrys monachus]
MERNADKGSMRVPIGSGGLWLEGIVGIGAACRARPSMADRWGNGNVANWNSHFRIWRQCDGMALLCSRAAIFTADAVFFGFSAKVSRRFGRLYGRTAAASPCPASEICYVANIRPNSTKITGHGILSGKMDMKADHANAMSSHAFRPAAALARAVVACGLACVSALPAAAQNAADVPAAQAPAAQVPAGRPAPGPVKVDPGVLLKFTRSTLIALDQANKTGNYTVLRDLGSPDFQKVNTAARLAEIFASERQAGLDLSNAAVLEPVVTQQPEINADGLLHYAGYFPAGSDQLRFEFLFQAVGTSWQLFGLSVNLGNAAGAPAAAPPAAAAPVAKPAPAKPTHGKAAKEPAK